MEINELNIEEIVEVTGAGWGAAAAIAGGMYAMVEIGRAIHDAVCEH